jgi:hypothetical protein
MASAAVRILLLSANSIASSNPYQPLLIIHYTDQVHSGVSQHGLGDLVQGCVEVHGGWLQIQSLCDYLYRCVSPHHPFGSHGTGRRFLGGLGLDLVESSNLGHGQHQQQAAIGPVKPAHHSLGLGYSLSQHAVVLNCDQEGAPAYLLSLEEATRRPQADSTEPGMRSIGPCAFQDSCSWNADICPAVEQIRHELQVIQNDNQQVDHRFSFPLSDFTMTGW